MSGLAAIEKWFTTQGWQPFSFQHEVWQAYRNGESGLIHAPTGTGKSYAAWLGAVAEWLDEDVDFKPTKRRPHPPLRVLWITPMRALANDTARNLQRPLVDLDVPWSVETRTGDTSSAARQRQRRRLPTCLVTTPESLSLILTWENGRDLLSDLRLVVVDEWHELLASKRGVQTELGLARLRRWNPELRTWGLSATMGNLDTALQVLLGAEATGGHLVRGDLSKQLDVDAIIPESMARFPWAGHLALKLLPEVIDIIDGNRTTLIFCNTRSQVERWYQALLDARADYAGVIALHHSSMDRSARQWVEEGLRQQQLKCVVCTSSLDLGVDFPEVDAVLQVSSPKGVARLLQRAGRSGHQPGEASRVICVPAHALELIEISAARLAVQQGHMEERPPLDNALDVLVQHLVTVGLGGGFASDALYDEVRTAYSYRNLTRTMWDWALDFVGRGGAALQAYEQYRRVVPDGASLKVVDKQVARLHRMSIGTITSDAMLTVQYLKGPKIGQIEESFISRLKPGDRFTLGGKVLEYRRIKDLKVYVRRATGSKGVVPRWYGGRLPLSETLTTYIRQRLDEAQQGIYADDEMRALIPILNLQAKWSRIPGGSHLLLERTKTREGYHLFVYPFAGRLVHEGLAALLAYRISRGQPITFTLAANDYGFEMLAAEPVPLDDATARALFTTDNLLDDILASMNASEMARRQFREVARVSGLVYERYPGGQKTAKQLQASAGLIYDVLRNYDADNLLLSQAQNEVLSRQLEHTRLARTLERINASEITICETAKPTPFAFPLLVDRLRQTVSSETLADRVERMMRSLEKAADKA